jgi:hypothetical protein
MTEARFDDLFSYLGAIKVGSLVGHSSVHGSFRLRVSYRASNSLRFSSVWRESHPRNTGVSIMECIRF